MLAKILFVLPFALIISIALTTVFKIWNATMLEAINPSRAVVKKVAVNLGMPALNIIVVITTATGLCLYTVLFPGQ